MAQADTYYASVTGAPTDPCSSANPCDIGTATQTAVNTGDEVLVRPGTYTLGANNIEIEPGVYLHGEKGKPKPVITSSASYVLSSTVGDHVSDLVLAHTGSTAVFAAGGAGTVFERIAARSDSPRVCTIGADAIVRDSICLNNGTVNGATAVIMAENGNSTATLRNVTAIATGANSYGILVNSPGGNLTIDARNTIAQGAGSDAAAAAPVSGSATINFGYSNYAYLSSTSGGTGTASITSPNAATIQNAADNPPVFADPGGGDYHQAAGSPTIDGGAADGFTGAFDFDGEKRLSGPHLDIGFDEYDSTPPKTTITAGPRGTVRRSARHATFTFRFKSSEAGSTFKCKLDRRAYKTCGSGPNKKSYRVGRGKHTFRVKARDANGNTDASAAHRSFALRPPRTHHHHH